MDAEERKNLKERLKRTLSDDLTALRRGKSVLGATELADELEQLGPDYRFLARSIREAWSRFAQPDLGKLATEYAKAIEKLEGEDP